jgi:hypothetical protein
MQHVIDKIIIIMYIIFLLVNWYIADAIIYELIKRHGAITLSSVVSWLLGFIWLTNFSICYYIILLLILNIF